MSIFEDLRENQYVPNPRSMGYAGANVSVRVAVTADAPVEVVVVPDHTNHVFVAAVQGPATPDNVQLALERLELAIRQPLDVLAIAFEGSSIPMAAERKRLAQLGVNVVMGASHLQPLARARAYARRLVSLADDSPLNARAA